MSIDVSKLTRNIVIRPPTGAILVTKVAYNIVIKEITDGITSVTPNSGLPAGGTSVTISGLGFTSATDVTFGGVSATNVTVVSDTEITCDTPAGSAGIVDVVVVRPTTNLTLTNGFLYLLPVPTISDVTPNEGVLAGGTVVTITGTNLTGATGATFGGNAATGFSVDSDTTITCTTPAGSSGFVDVVVTHAYGDATLTNGFQYTDIASPDLVSVDPTSGDVNGGTAVTLTGTGFTGVSSVTFGGVAATSVVVTDDTEITCVTPEGAAVGLVDVVVTNSAGSDTLTDGYEYILIAQPIRVTQAPLLVVNKPNQPVRVTQIPILAVNLPQQGTRITQAPILVPWLPPSIPKAKPLIPEEPVTEIWEWLTVVNVAEFSNEQRSALRKYPRVHSTFEVLLMDDAERRAVYEFVKRNLTEIFDYPLYQYSTPLTQTTAAGDTKLYFDPAHTDLRADEKLALFDPQAETQVLYEISSVDSDGATLLTGLLTEAKRGWYVAPVCQFRFRGTAGFVMQSISGQMTFSVEGTQLRDTLRPGQSSALLTKVNDLLVLNKRPLANDDVDENFNRNVTWLDIGTNEPVSRTNWYAAMASGERSFLVHRPGDLDYWRAVGDYLKGRQNPFLMPTWRADLNIVEEPALGATVLISDAIWFYEFWLTTAYRYIMIQSDAGTIYRRILEVTMNYTEDGDPVTINVKLDSSIGSGTGANTNLIVSFLNTCRLDSDQIRFDHGALDTVVTIKTRVVQA